MRVLFVYPNVTGHENISLGLATLSAFLKQLGHEVRLADFTWDLSIQDCLNDIFLYQPNIIGISVLSGSYRFAVGLANEIKKNFFIPIIFGGVHPTIAPEKTLMQKSVDMICIGEGEHALAELLEAMSKKRDLTKIRNIWTKDGNDRIVRNDVRPLIADLSLLPPPDIELYNFKRYLKATSGAVDVISGRGCPYRCAYCINQSIQGLYGIKGKKFLRRNTVDNTLLEIRKMSERYDIKHIKFEDDLFTMDKEWLEDFSSKYPSMFSIPFSCNARVETMSIEIASLLKQAGCISISMGIESGSERIRKEILRRNMSNDMIIKAFDSAKQAGLNVISYNMVGIPTETSDDMLETIKINQIVKPDFLGISIFLPYPGTPLFDLCIKHGWIKEDFKIPSTHRLKSVVQYSHVSTAEIKKWKTWFRFKVLKSVNMKKAFVTLFFDLIYDRFYTVRRRLPSWIKIVLFKINGWLRWSESEKTIGSTKQAMQMRNS